MSYIDIIAERPDMVSPGISTCAGCALEIGMRRVMKIAGENSLFSLPPGCAAGGGTMGWNDQTGMKVPVHISLLGNMGALMSGVTMRYQQLGRDDVNIVAFAGDGASADCGFQSLSGAAERGEHMLYVCYDNEGYMNTGFQRSSTTGIGSRTSTTPVGSVIKGKVQPQKNMPMIMAMHNVEYMATLSPSHMKDFVEKVEKALAASKRGFAYLHLFTPCPTGWGFSPEKSIEVARQAVKTDVFPLYEVEGGVWKRTVKNSSPAPVGDYAKMLKKYAHLDDDVLQQWQDSVDGMRDFLDRVAL